MKNVTEIKVFAFEFYDRKTGLLDHNGDYETLEAAFAVALGRVAVCTGVHLIKPLSDENLTRAMTGARRVHSSVLGLSTEGEAMKMLCLEYLPNPRSRAWRRSSLRMRLAGRANMEATAKALQAQEGWHAWRIVED